LVAEPQITLAAIAGAHGIGGEVRLKLFSAGLDTLKLQRQVQVGERLLTLKSVRGGAQPVARFAEIADRNAAEALRGQLVSVPRSALPPLAEDEYYHADLIGLACVSSDGAHLGAVIAVVNFGAGDIIEIEKPDGKKAMVPLRPGVADLLDDRIVADPEFLA
jgi:16S rRNA processing protein RimM